MSKPKRAIVLLLDSLNRHMLGCYGGTDADILDAILWSAGISVPGVPDNPNPAKVNSFVRITQLLQSGGSPNCSENAQWVSLDGRTLNAMPLSPGTFATPGEPGLYILMASPCNAPGPNVQIKIPVIVLP